MHILLTNDDGIDSPGLHALCRAMRELGDVTAIAPREEQSGAGHAITYRQSIEVNRAQVCNGIPAWAVDGTPADCVKFGVLEALDHPPDLVVSGINMGFNVGINVFYSGTVAAALEGAIQGISAVAVSGNYRPDDDLSAPARRAREIIEDHDLLHHSPGKVYNINLPAGDEHTGRVLFTRSAGRVYDERYRRKDSGAEDDPRYQLELAGDRGHAPEGVTDVQAVRGGHISVTPLAPSCCDMEHLRTLEKRDKRGGNRP
ncbi:MAG: 5'/3'-nucleotidase SurE [Planctomycetota bacterium]